MYKLHLLIYSISTLQIHFENVAICGERVFSSWYGATLLRLIKVNFKFELIEFADNFASLKSAFKLSEGFLLTCEVSVHFLKDYA